MIQKGYINFKEANIGYVPYTQRNALNLAFNHLNSPYGWGGANGEQDCSGYLGQIFNEVKGRPRYIKDKELL